MGTNETGHTVLYRAGVDSRIDRANIALLKRIVQKSTTPVQLEIYYHQPLKLSDWAEPHEHVRYIRLRSGDPFPIAERIAASANNAVVVLGESLLLAAADLWQLMGLTKRHSLTVVTPSTARHYPGEGTIGFAFRQARLQLRSYLYPAGDFSASAFAVNKALLSGTARLTPGSFNEKKTYADFLRSLAAAQPKVIRARSYAMLPAEGNPLLGTGFRTVEAFGFWRREKKFPYWFNPRLPLFHVAQIAVYYGALVALISPGASLIVFLFAVAITPQFFLTGLSFRAIHRIPLRLGTRFLLYFVG